MFVGCEKGLAAPHLLLDKRTSSLGAVGQFHREAVRPLERRPWVSCIMIGRCPWFSELSAAC